MNSNIQQAFLIFKKNHNFKENINQDNLIKSLASIEGQLRSGFFFKVKNFFSNLNYYQGFYLYGDVGAGKTAIINFFLDNIQEKKVLRTHFNKFMIEIHYLFQIQKKNKNPIANIAKDYSKKFNVVFLDEFQITNIVDAMLLKNLFEEFFNNNIFIIMTSNIKPDELYRDGLQRGQFLPFIDILKKKTFIFELSTGNDYRLLFLKNKKKFLSPITRETKKIFNETFKKFVGNKETEKLVVEVKKRKVVVNEYSSKAAKFNFKDLCGQNIGSEDYLELSKYIKTFFIKSIPSFNDDIVDQQQRFITLIDILYNKKINLVCLSEAPLENLRSSKKLNEIFKRTTSRLFEMTNKY